VGSNSFRGIIFDVDGVIVRSSLDHAGRKKSRGRDYSFDNSKQSASENADLEIDSIAELVEVFS